MNTSFYLCFVCSALSLLNLNACAETPSATVYYKGLIDNNFIEVISTVPGRKWTLVLASNGGESDHGLQAANIISQKNITLIIDGDFGICASGCAEFILPAAKTVEFRNQPIIGYHQNPQMMWHLVQAYSKKNVEYCDFIKIEVENTQRLLRKKELKEDFWQHTLEKLVLLDYKPIYRDKSCPGSRRTFRNELWLPTSQDLKSHLNLKFSGELCADRSEVCSARVETIWPENTGLVIGNTSYVTGRKVP